MPNFNFLGGEIVHYPLSNGVDEVSEQFFFAQTGFSTVCSKVGTLRYTFKVLGTPRYNFEVGTPIYNF